MDSKVYKDHITHIRAILADKRNDWSLRINKILPYWKAYLRDDFFSIPGTEKYKNDFLQAEKYLRENDPHFQIKAELEKFCAEGIALEGKLFSVENIDKIEKIFIEACKGKANKMKNNPSDRTHYRFTRKKFCDEFLIDKKTLRKRLADCGTYLGQHVVNFQKKLWVPFASYEQLRTECGTDRKKITKNGV